MRRSSTRRSLLLVIAILALVGGGLYAAVTYVPPFYAKATRETDDLEFGLQSSRLMTRANDLANDINGKAEWGTTFTAAEINGFLREYATDLQTRLGGRLHDPLVGLTGDRVQVGLRCGSGPTRVVFWVELRAWLAKAEPNCLAVEICSIKAGLIPIAGQSILDRVTEAARESNIEVSWYRHNGKPVGMFRLFADQSRRQPKQLRVVQIQDGQLTLAGRTTPEGTSIPAGIDPAFGRDN